MDMAFTDFTCGVRSACLSNKYRRPAGSAYGALAARQG